MYKNLLLPLFKDIWNFLLDILLPKICICCNTEGQFICTDCKSKLETLEHQHCIVCQKQAPFGITHPRCQTSLSADQLISHYDYHDKNLSKIIIAGKYKFVKNVFEDLGQNLATKIKQEHSYLLLDQSYRLVPIPLHSARRRWRGFNQAEILCQTLSKELNLPIANILKRSKLTKTQKDLKKDHRLKNIKDAFGVVPSPFEGRVREGLILNPKSYILVDDVTTTGATLQEAAKILKRNGATKVICLCLARD